MSRKAGGDPAVVGPWIAKTRAKKVAAEAEIRAATGQRQMAPDRVAAIDPAVISGCRDSRTAAISLPRTRPVLAGRGN
jgi:hypothetical protein